MGYMCTIGRCVEGHQVTKSFLQDKSLNKKNELPYCHEAVAANKVYCNKTE